VAAAAGEVAKDDKHLAAVEKVDSDFIPLVVETFGIWTPFVKQLQLIADHTTPIAVFQEKLLENTCCSNCQYNCGPIMLT